MTIEAPPAAPGRSLEQRQHALRLANRVRCGRADLKRDIKAGRVCAFAILADPPELVATMKVLDLLLAAPKVGRVKANKALIKCRISPSKTIGGMTRRQRRELVAYMQQREV